MENQNQEKKQEGQTVLPKARLYASASISPIVSKEGKAFNTPEPRFSVSLPLKSVLAMPTRNIEKDGKEINLIDLAIVPNKKKEDNASPFLVVGKREGQDAVYAGKNVKFVDKDSVMELTLVRNVLLGKAQQLGIKRDEPIQLQVGKIGAGTTGVTLDPSAYKEMDKKQLEIPATLRTVNAFDRILRSQQNMGNVPANKYTSRFIGSAYNFVCHDKNGEVVAKKNDEPVYGFNLQINANSLKFLPEADHFGNVNLALVKRNLDPEKLAEKGLYLPETGNVYPVKKVGDKEINQPNHFILADPKTYMNGEPNANTVALIKVNKADLLRLPRTSEDFLAKDGKQVHNEFINLTIDRFSNLKPNVKEYEYNKISVPNERLNARVIHYQPELIQQERLNWEKNHPKLSEEDFSKKLEREKNMPNQFEAYNQAVRATEKKVYRDFSQSQEQEQNKRGLSL